MEPFFDQQVKELYDDAYKIINAFLKEKRQTDNATIHIPATFKAEFFRIVDKVNLSLLAYI